MLYTKTFLIQILRQFDREHGADVLTVINIRPGDPFDFASLGPCCNCGLPGISYGQARDCRYPTDGSEGLHAHVYSDRLAFHLDAVDACRDVVNHGVKDTRAVEGVLIGAGIAAFLAALSGGKSVGAAALTGAVAGGVLGAATPARRQKIVEFRDVVARVRAGFLAAA
jgi:hypothetical protein